MVSLRKGTLTSKFATQMFSEGERVLCYEVDPNKAKVLYDSKITKILDIIPQAGNSKRKKVEYCVHFYGWSRTYDRIVCEEYILKDTPSNRHLQRELAEQAVGSLKKGKKLKLGKIPASIIGSLNEQDQDTKDGYEHQAQAVDSMYAEDSSSSNFYTYTTNSNNSTSNELTNQSNFANGNSQSGMTEIETNQGAIKLVNEETLFKRKEEQVDKQSICNQIIANFDDELKRLLDKDQQLIAVEKAIYKLPIKPEYSVHSILLCFEKFSLRMLETSNKLADFETQTILNDQNSHLNNPANQQASSSHFISSNSSGSSGAASLGVLNSGKNHPTNTNALSTVSNTTSPNSFSSQTIREFTNSIEIYFNTLTEKLFIFYSNKEKEQYQQLKTSNNQPIHLFGFAHLLRLIIILPDFLSVSSIPTKQLKQLVFIMKHFCNYLVENKSKFMS